MHTVLIVFGACTIAIEVIGYAIGVCWLMEQMMEGAGWLPKFADSVFVWWLLSPFLLLCLYVLVTRRPEFRPWCMAVSALPLVLYAIACSVGLNWYSDYLQKDLEPRFIFLRRTLFRGLALLFAAISIAAGFGILRAAAVSSGLAVYSGNERFLREYDRQRDEDRAEYLHSADSCRDFLQMINASKTSELEVHSPWFRSKYVNLPDGAQGRKGRIGYQHVSGTADVPIAHHYVTWEPAGGAICRIELRFSGDPTSLDRILVPELTKDIREEILDLDGLAEQVHEHPSSMILFALASTCEIVKAKVFEMRPANASAERLDGIVGWLDPILTLFACSIIIELGAMQRHLTRGSHPQVSSA